MRYLKKFEKFTQFTMYNSEWEKYLPQELTVIKNNKTRTFHLENVMLNEDQIEIDYVANQSEYGEPDEMEIDIYMLIDGKLELDIDITYGDLMVSEFKVTSPNTVSVTQYTSYHSKFDPSNTVFAFNDESLKKLVDFLNNFDNMNLRVDNFTFLDSKDNYNPQ